MHHTERHDRPLPHLIEEKSQETTRLHLGLDDRRGKKFSLYDLLARVSDHPAGEMITLREGDEILHEPLQEAGLVSIHVQGESTEIIRTGRPLAHQDIFKLTFTIKEKLLAVLSQPCAG